MKGIYVVLVIALIYNSQAFDLKEADVLNKLHEVREYVGNISQEIQNVAKEFEDNWGQLATEHSRRLEAQVDEALLSLNSYPDECAQVPRTQLLAAKATSVGGFIHCSNLTSAFVDTGSIIFKTLQLASNVAMSVYDIMQLSESCNTWNPFSLIKCWVGKITRAISDVKVDLDALKQYKDDVVRLGKEIKETIEYCFGHHQNALQFNINSALEKANACRRNMH